MNKLIIMGVALAALVNTTYMLILWWFSAFASPQWEVTLVFNIIGEQYVEGILLHLLMVTSIAGSWQIIGLLKRKS